MRERTTVQIVYAMWRIGVAHRAKTVLHCAGYQCRRLIQPGELYTRHKPVITPHYYARHPFCQQCVPFRVLQNSVLSLAEVYQATAFGRKDAERWSQE